MTCGINPKSGRCVQGSTFKPQRCRRDKKTRRCRKKDARSSPLPKQKSCPKGKIMNPATNRCVSKTSKVAMKFLITKETTTIGGPIDIAYYQIEFGGVKKHILLFGDEHTTYPYPNEDSVITVATLLKKIIRNSPHCIDLFVEHQVSQRQMKAQGKKLQSYSNPLTAIRNEFGACPIHDTSVRKCPYSNLRYQNWDLRFQITSSNIKTNPYDEVLIIPRAGTRISKLPKHILFKYLLGFPIPLKDRKRMDKVFEELFKTYKNRELFREEAGDVEFQRHMEHVNQREYQKMLQSVPKFPKDFLKTFMSVYKNMADTTESYSNEYTHIFTDFYLLCRLFKQFKVSSSKSKRTPKRCPLTKAQRMKTKQSQTYATPQYIIIYAGSDHNKYVGKFLRSMFSVKPLFHSDMKFNKKISLKDIHYSQAFQKPDTLMGLFQPYLDA